MIQDFNIFKTTCTLKLEYVLIIEKLFWFQGNEYKLVPTNATRITKLITLYKLPWEYQKYQIQMEDYHTFRSILKFRKINKVKSLTFKKLSYVCI